MVSNVGYIIFHNRILFKKHEMLMYLNKIINNYVEKLFKSIFFNVKFIL